MKLRQSGTSNPRLPLGIRLTPLFPTPEPWSRPAPRAGRRLSGGGTAGVKWARLHGLRFLGRWMGVSTGWRRL